MITNALLNGVIWSVLWIAYVYMLLKCFPWEMVHEYMRRRIPRTREKMSHS